MIKVSKRIQCLASFIDKEDVVIDVGCDHAFLPIYLFLEKQIRRVYASDVNEHVIQIAKKNIEAMSLGKEIPVLHGDGLNSIPEEVDTAVIAGMGAGTIINILKRQERPLKKYVIQANNDIAKLRLFFNQNHYRILNEKILFEEGHYYTLLCYVPGEEKLEEEELLYGKFNQENIAYYSFIKRKLQSVYQKIPNYQVKKKKEIENKLHFIDIYLQKESRGVGDSDPR